MEPVTQQKNVVTEMVLPLGHALMVLVFVASFRLLVVQPQARIARI